MKKRIISSILCAAMAISLVACGGGAANTSSNSTSGTASSGDSAASGDGVTITIMGNANDLAKSYMESIFAQYEEATGNKLDIIALENDNFNTVATSKFAAGEIPDIFQNFNDSNLSNYDPENNFYFLNDEAWVDDLTDGAKAYATDDDGHLVGLPYWESSISGFYYNKTILDELGLKPATTQTELDKLCDDLMAAGYTPFAWPTNGCGWALQFAFDPIFADDPALLEKLNTNQTTLADIPAVKDAVTWCKNAAENGWFGDSYLTDGWDDMSVLLGTGEGVIMPVWDTWFSTDFDESYDYTADDFALMPIFMGSADEGTYEGGNLNMLMANKNSEHLDVVLDFLAFCANPDNYNVAFEGVSTVNVFKGQTTNIQSSMVTDAQASIDKCQRVSTANPKIIGYTQSETNEALQAMYQGEVDVDGCIKLMDEYRIASAQAKGVEGF